MNKDGLKAVVFDLDGTLAESKQPLSMEMAVELKKLLDFKKVAVVSGAGFSQFETQFLTHLTEGVNKENLYVFATNGAEGYVFENGVYKSLYEEKLSENEKEKIIFALRELTAEISLPNGTKIHGEQIEDRGSQITFSALGQEAPLEEKKKWDPDKKKRVFLAEKLRGRLPEFQISYGGMTSVDITKKGIDKAYMLKKFSEITKIPINEMIFVGDDLGLDGNDSPVRKTNIRTTSVSSPNGTISFLKNLNTNLN